MFRKRFHMRNPHMYLWKMKFIVLACQACSYELGPETGFRSRIMSRESVRSVRIPSQKTAWFYLPAVQRYKGETRSTTKTYRECTYKMYIPVRGHLFLTFCAPKTVRKESQTSFWAHSTLFRHKLLQISLMCVHLKSTTFFRLRLTSKNSIS